MSQTQNESLWQTLWSYDPNGLVATDLELNIRITNPAFCQMFNKTNNKLIGKPITKLIDCKNEFLSVWETQEAVRGIESKYEDFDLYVRKVIFPVPEEKLIAAIFVDLTSEWKQEKQMSQLKTAAIDELSAVVDKQMHIAQQIAGLLGETTAETKVGLIKLLEMLKQDRTIE